ncbi:MAG: hypothetical protein ABI775_06865 [Pseudonocardiales bacterium]
MTRHLVAADRGTPLLDASTDAQDVERLRERVEKLAKPCGCKSGAALTLLALIGWPVKVLADGVPRTFLGIVAVLATYPLIVFAAAIVGKGAGIVVGRVRRRWYQRRLSNHPSIATAPITG